MTCVGRERTRTCGLRRLLLDHRYRLPDCPELHLSALHQRASSMSRHIILRFRRSWNSPFTISRLHIHPLHLRPRSRLPSEILFEISEPDMPSTPCWLACACARSACGRGRIAHASRRDPLLIARSMSPPQIAWSLVLIIVSISLYSSIKMLLAPLQRYAQNSLAYKAYHSMGNRHSAGRFALRGSEVHPPRLQLYRRSPRDYPSQGRQRSSATMAWLHPR